MITPNKPNRFLTVSTEMWTTNWDLNWFPLDGFFKTAAETIALATHITSMESATMKNRRASSPWTTTEKTLPRSVKSPAVHQDSDMPFKTPGNGPQTLRSRNVRAMIHRFATSTYNFTMYAQREEVILCLDYIRWHIRLFFPTGCFKSVRMRLPSNL